MTNTMIPIIRQLHDADGDRARARILLVMPDSIMLSYAKTVGDAGARASFQAGAEYVLRRVTLMRAVRGRDGLLPKPLADEFDEYRTALAVFANGEATS